MTAVTLYGIHPERKMARYYTDDQVNLFGMCCLVKEWVRIGRSGETRLTALDDESLALAYFEKYQGLKKHLGKLRHVADSKSG